MKCQRCDKSATFHITELTSGKPQELHLCEEHARQYLTESDNEQPGANLAGALAQQLVGGTAEELARLDQQTQLIRLRREMKDAIQAEDYEKASQLRDEIRRIERSV